MPASIPARVASSVVMELRAAVRSSSWRGRVGEGLLAAAIVAAGGVQLALGDVAAGDAVLGVPRWVVVLGSVATVLVVLVRRLWPTTALIMAVLLLAAPVFAWLFVPVVVFAAARHLPAARLWAAAGAAAGALLLVDVLLRNRYGDPLQLVLASWAVTVALVVVAPAVCGALVGRRRPAGRLLRERERHLQRTRAHIAERARRAELTRITGEMHDMLGHRLALLSIHAGALEVQTAQLAPAASAQAEFVRRTAGTALAELRQILTLTGAGARESDVAAAEVAGTRADVEALVDGSRAAGLTVMLRWDGEDIGGADPRVRHAVHRTTREGLTNVHKHAPTAPTVTVDVVVGDNRVVVRVSNTAPRQAAPGHGTAMGLIGLRQRAELLGGTCRGRRTPDGGFQLTLDLPAVPPETVPERGPRRPGTVLPEIDPSPDEELAIMTAPRLIGVVAVGALIVVPVLVALVALAEVVA